MKGNHDKDGPSRDRDFPEMHKLARQKQHARTSEKALFLFLLYQQMGPDKSLDNLKKLCTDVKLRVSVNTLKRYSSQFQWQKKLLENEAQRHDQIEKQASEVINEMNERHVVLNKGLMSLAMAGLQHYMAERQKNEIAGIKGLKLEPGEIANLVRQGQTGERLARGQATSRIEVMAEVIESWVIHIAAIFEKVNILVDPEQRKFRFAQLVDEKIKGYLGEGKKGEGE